MKVLKIILIIVLVIIGVFVIINAFLPANYTVERSTTVDAPKEIVFEQVVDFKNWEQWSPWLAMDSTMTFNYGEQTKGAGATYSWTGESSGNGSQEMTAVVNMDTIKTHIIFEGMGESDGQWVFSENEDGSTNVSWSFSGENSFFLRLFSVMMDGMVGPQFENGLNSLKTVAEAKAEAMPKLEVIESTREAINYYGIRNEIATDEVNSTFFSEHYAKIGKYLGEDMQNMNGAPMALYYTWDMETQKTDMAAALPVMSTKEGNDTIMPGTLPAGPVLMVNYYGNYNGTGDAHYLIETYAKEKGLTIGAPAAEIYVTDPSTEPDTAKWLTQVVYPITQ